ncbi:MAG: RNA methyltransferase [Kiritimatiellaeota bacterium]|nr:RNA methyltransferase [Kiritimatiellota bacterium]
MTDARPTIASLQNPRVKQVVKLRDRGARDAAGLLLIEGYREVKRALDNRWPCATLFHCPELFMGGNERALLERAAAGGTELVECTEPVFRKMAYRDRPEGLLALAPQVRRTLADLRVPAQSLLIVTEAIEKPGNLGTILRSADAAGVQAVIVCDRGTDVNNPNVVRASLGTLFSVPVAEAGSPETLAWLRARGLRVLAAPPHADREYTDADLTGGLAIVVGAEQYGLSSLWMEHADVQVKIPMLGQGDSLNVAAATTILLYEAVRQRRGRGRLKAEGGGGGTLSTDSTDYAEQEGRRKLTTDHG